MILAAAILFLPASPPSVRGSEPAQEKAPASTEAKFVGDVPILLTLDGESAGDQFGWIGRNAGDADGADDADAAEDGDAAGAADAAGVDDADDADDADTDDDGDGIDTYDENPETDSECTPVLSPVLDGVPNYLDYDSDGDGITDAVEGAPGPRVHVAARGRDPVDSRGRVADDARGDEAEREDRDPHEHLDEGEARALSLGTGAPHYIPPSTVLNSMTPLPPLPRHSTRTTTGKMR